MEIKLTVTTTGGAGASAGTATSDELVEGFLEYIGLDFTSQPATTDVTLTDSAGRVLWAKTNNGTDATYYPMAASSDSAGAAISGGYKPIYISRRKLTLTVAQGDDNAVAVVATIIISPIRR